MKKKVLSLCMAAALVLGSGTAAMADTVEEKDTSVSHEVRGTYQHMAAAATVYKVDVEWGSMEFTYQEPNTTRHWNAKTHKYEEIVADTGTWSVSDGQDMIKVTNYSNKAITATITVAIDQDKEGITAVPLLLQIQIRQRYSRNLKGGHEHEKIGSSGAYTYNGSFHEHSCICGRKCFGSELRY